MIYIAGPLFSQAEREFNVVLAKRLEKEAIDGIVFLPQERIILGDDDTAREIAADCLSGLDESRIVIAILDGSDVDSGTAFEVGYAYAKDKPVFGLRTDFREMRDVAGCPVNAMFSLCTKICKNIEELLDAINKP